MGHLERNLLSTQDLSGTTSGSRVPTILPTAIPDTTYLGSARSTTLLQPFALTIFGDTKGNWIRDELYWNYLFSNKNCARVWSMSECVSSQAG